MHIKKRLFPLKKQLYFVMTIFVICILSIAIYSANNYTRLQTALMKNNLELYSSQLASTTTEMYESCRNIAYNIAYDQIVQNYILEQSPDKRYVYYQQAYSQLANSANLNQYLVDIAIISNRDNNITLYGTLNIYIELSEQLTEPRYSFKSMGKFMVNGANCQIFAMPIHKISSGKTESLGNLFLAINTDSFFANNQNKDVTYLPESMLIDENGILLYGDSDLYHNLPSSYEETTFEAAIDHTTYIINRYPVSSSNNVLYVFTKKALFESLTREIALLQLVCMAIVLFLIFFIILQTYRPLIRSLQQLTEFMKDITNRNRKNYKDGIILDQGLIGSTEIAEITNAFNEMLEKTDELNHTIFDNYTRMYEMEINTRRTEIAFLRSQINPHFLYNTLTMICGMSADHMTNEVIETANALSQIFRYSIKGADIVTLREEMNIVESYLKIQEMRFENRFSIRYDLDEDSMDCMIPKMIIQPLVENAIVHGLEPSNYKGELLIRSLCNANTNDLLLQIFDTGKGIAPSRLKEIKEALKNASTKRTKNVMDTYQDMDLQHHDSIGILNVNSRIILYFDEAYSMTIESEEGVGTCVQLRIPLDYKRKKENKDVSCNRN